MGQMRILFRRHLGFRQNLQNTKRRECPAGNPGAGAAAQLDEFPVSGSQAEFMARNAARHFGEYQKFVQGAEWVGSVHVDQRKDNGLSARDLRTAVEGGMRRISFGLESGSQRILDAAKKGCTVEANRKFIRDAHRAGLSVRATMFKGFPGEGAEDMEETANFLEENAAYLDRVRFNDFSLLPDTPIWNDVQNFEAPLDIIRLDTQRGRAIYRNRAVRSKEYRRAKRRALNAVYAINKRPLRDAARQFDGLM